MTEKVEKPSKEVLEKLITEKGYRYTGEKYGVSDNTARRWAMAYGIDLNPKCELKKRSRQGYQMVDGRFVYDKYISKKKTRVPKEKSDKVKTPRVKKESTVANGKGAIAKTVAKTSLVQSQDTPIAAVVVMPTTKLAPAADVVSKSRNRYSQAELEFFRKVVEGKIQEGFEAIQSLKESLSRVGNGTDDTASSGNIFEEGTEAIERENMTEQVAKKQKHLNALSGALHRIGNGTYGICIVTGNLIPKERLMAVPHATKCVEAKTDSDNGKVVTPVAEVGGEEDEK